MFIVQVCSGILPRYLCHYQMTDSDLAPVFTVNIDNALPMTQADANLALTKLTPRWPAAQVVEV